MRRRVALVGIVTGALGAGAGCLATRGPVVPTGALAPDFDLESHLGGRVSLDALVADGPAVLVFYRGFW